MGKIADNKKEIEALVLRVQGGDKAAFSQIYDIFIDQLYKYVYYRVKKEDAEDLVEMVFFKVWKSIKKYKNDPKSSFSSWLFRIAHNLIVDYYRKNKDLQFDELVETIKDEKREHNPIKTTENKLRQDVLKDALKGLKDPYQEVIIQKFLNGLSNKEIAKILKKSEGSVRVIQFRALKALKIELESKGVKHEF